MQPSTSSPRPVLTGIQMFDKHLRNIPSGGLVAGNVIEVAGRSGTGKTELMYAIILSCILPESQMGVQYGGQGIQVLYIDLSMKFSIPRLQYLLSQRVKLAFNNRHGESILVDGENEVTNLFDECFDRLFVVQPASTEEFLAALHQVNAIKESNQSLRLIIIDDISTFFFPKRNSGESFRFMKQLQSLLHSVLLKNNLSCIVTKPLLFPNAMREAEELKHSISVEHLGPEWYRFVTFRIILNMYAIAEEESQTQSCDSENILNHANATVQSDSTSGQSHSSSGPDKSAIWVEGRLWRSERNPKNFEEKSQKFTMYLKRSGLEFLEHPSSMEHYVDVTKIEF
eukprot:215371_1